MGRLATTFRRLKKANEAALVAYVTVGYPSLDLTRRLVPIIARQGADLIELGVPFSDPMADGATVQRASHAALEQGVSLSDCLSVAAEARRTNEVPLLFMSYYNPIFKYGLDEFVRDCATFGVDGLIIPDLPPEEAGELKSACHVAGIDLIFLVAPTSTDERLQKVAELASGFVYCVSLTGVTGARSEVGEGLEAMLERVRRHTDLPLVVGFGISKPEHVARVSQAADGAVVGSALINVIESHPDEDEVILSVSEYIRDMKEATRRPQQP
ncbi:MAG TPA: tryptophan synthase subunit alpha [Chloroflexia bacterium]